MNRIFVLSTLLGVCVLSFASLPPNNRYGAPHPGNSLGYRGGSARGLDNRGGHGRYSAPQSGRGPVSHFRGPSAPSAPHAPSAPRSPSYGGHQSGPRNSNYGGHQSGSSLYGGHQSAPGPYGGGSRHLGGASGGLNQYSGPAPYGGPLPYGGQAHASGLSHISSPRRSVYESQQASSSSSSNTGYSQPQPKLYSQVHESAESRSQTHGREMKYTIKDPHNKGTTHVSETHVVSNRQMHGAEAEAAMKKLMGSMGPGSDNGFGDIFKGFGLPFY